MTYQKHLKTLLFWLPSLLVLIYYIPTALDKLIHPNQTGKIVESSTVMIIAGSYILCALGLFLYNKTRYIGTALLALYMVSIILIHLYKGKPAELLVLLLIATIFAVYIRPSKT